jgi:hypothetical protein
VSLFRVLLNWNLPPINAPHLSKVILTNLSMNIGIDDMSFYRISLSSLEEVRKSIINQDIKP